MSVKFQCGYCGLEKIKRCPCSQSNCDCCWDCYIEIEGDEE